MKNDKNTARLHRKLSLRWGAPVYALLLLYALVMTQLLRNPISAVFFWFMIIVGPLSLFLMFLGKALIQVYVFSGTASSEKNAPVDYEIRVINQSPIPYPFVEALISQPSTDALKSLEEKLNLSLVPFGGYDVKRTVSFGFRGLYEIGVSELYITDILHIFRLRVDIDNFSNVTVYARQLDLRTSSQMASSDIPTPSARITDTRDLSEIKDIREYVPGDPIKNIHWKLTAKSEETLVKDHNTNTDRHTYIFVDLSKPTPAPEIKREKDKKAKRILVGSGKYTDMLTQRGENGAIIVKSRISNVISGLSAFFEKNAERRRRKKNQRRRSKGISKKDIETIEMIDELIKSTSGKSSKIAYESKKKEKEELENAATEIAEKAGAEKDAENDVLEKLRNVIGGIEEDNVLSRDEALLRWGGKPMAEYEDTFPEYCADGVAEIAVSSMLSELRHGNYCTVVWFAGDNDTDISKKELTSKEDFDDICSSFSTAPVVSHERRIASLTDIIGESVNVTVRIVTANLDPSAASEYVSVPQKFGGAGTGCVTELMIFNPAEKYENPKRRLEYVEDMKAEMRQNGIITTEIVETTASDGSPMFTSTDLL